MSNFVENSVMSFTIRDNSDFIYNASAEQVDGVGGSGGDYQIRGSASIASTLTDGHIIARVISNYNPGTDTKTGIETEFGIGGWPIDQPVIDLNGAGVFDVVSADNLTASTGYHFLFFWISDYYYNTVFETQTQGLQDAIDDTDAQGGITIWPIDDSVIATNEVVISGTTSPATDIVFSGSVVEGSGAGTVVGIASANRTNGTNPWSIQSQDASLVSIDAATGQVVIAAGQTAPSATTYNLTLRYDNSSVTGGGTYDEAVSFEVTAATASTPLYLAMPAVNANGNGQDRTAEQIETIVDNLDSNWASECTALGIATTGVDVVIELAAGNLGDLTINNVGPFTDGSNTRYVHIRGQGAYSRNSWQPTSGTNLGKLTFTNVEGVRLWGVSASNSSSSPCHEFNNCTDVQINRCHLSGDVAQSSAALEDKPSVSVGIEVYAADNLTFRQCTLMGFQKTVFTHQSGVADGVKVRECVTAQNSGDVFKCGQAAPATNWQITNLYCTGIIRDPYIEHADLVQCQGTGIATGWSFDGVYCNWDDWTGRMNGEGIGLKPFQKASGATMNDFTVTELIYSGGAKIATGGPNGTSPFRYCDYIPPSDITAADNQVTSPWQAKRGGFGGISNIDYCFAISNAGSGDAADTPNGIVDYDAGYVAADNGAYDHSGYATYLENYSAPSGSPATTAASSAVPRRNYGVGRVEPKLGSGLHWDDTDPAGAYRFKERMFDSVTHDNPWDWGWPTCALFSIQYDTEQHCGGAGANSNGTSFDSDGD